MAGREQKSRVQCVAPVVAHSTPEASAHIQQASWFLPLWVVPSPPRSFCHLPIAPPAGDQASAQASRDRVSWFFCFVLFYWGFFFLVFRSRQGFCIALAVLELNVDQADLELRNPPASASQVLGLKVCKERYLGKRRIMLVGACL